MKNLIAATMATLLLLSVAGMALADGADCGAAKATKKITDASPDDSKKGS